MASGLGKKEKKRGQKPATHSSRLAAQNGIPLTKIGESKRVEPKIAKTDPSVFFAKYKPPNVDKESDITLGHLTKMAKWSADNSTKYKKQVNIASKARLV